MNIKTRCMKDSGRAAPARSSGRWLRAALQPIERMCTTRTNAQLGLISDMAVSVGLFYMGMRRDDVRPIAVLSAVLFGLVLFSFFEYAMHRWLFHGPAQVFQQGHLTHHQQPLGYDSLPFFLTPLAILALAGLLDLAAPTAVALLFAGAFAAGYVAYGLSHWAIHNIRFRNTLARRWAADHHIHHYHTDKNFGVTTPLWDIVLRTRYVSTRKSPKQSEITVRPNDRP